MSLDSKVASEEPEVLLKLIPQEFTFVKSRSDFTFFLDSSMVEHAAVNRGVVGSSPTRGV